MAKNYTPTPEELKPRASLLPSLAWVKKQLRNNLTCPLRTKVLKAFVVGSVAKGSSRPDSDLDIAVVIPAKKRISAIKFSQHFHLKLGLSGACYPSFNNRRVDFQFFYPSDACLAQYAKCELS
jgi:predicted nucleotidyltransferase